MRRATLSACAFFALVLPASGATQQEPSQVVSRVETGLVFVRAECKRGSYTGAGFLVGPRLAITARHIIQAEAGCVVTVRQQGSGAEARGTDWTTWFSRQRTDTTRTDLSVVRLDHPLHGYAFPVAWAAPKNGQDIVALGYAYAEGLSVTQGQVGAVARKGGVPEFDAQLSTAHGGFGGPIVNSSGQVVGLVQRGGERQIESVELAAFLGKDHRGLCQGVARATPSTLCGTAPVGGGGSSSRVYDGSMFAVRYPPGWRVRNGSTIVNPANPQWLVRIGHDAGNTTAGSHHVTFAGYRALRVELTGALRKVQIFFTDDAGTNWSVLYQAPASQWAKAAPRLQATVASLRLK